MTGNLSSAERRAHALPLALEWIGDDDGFLRLLDQTRLPGETACLECRTAEDVWNAIKVLAVRGAPAIGVAAAYGLCLGTRASRGVDPAAFVRKLEEVGTYLKSSRPTAVNLGWAVDRVIESVRRPSAEGAGGLWSTAFAEAQEIHREDAERCRRIGEHGADLIPEGGAVMTHCNAGALATSAYGTALSLMYAAHERGRRFRVFADETRPLLQGARLTAYELAAAGIDVTVICDGAAAWTLHTQKIDLVVVGADRIAANGDTANKIGTYGLAIAARRHGVPFYVAAPTSTFDMTLESGAAIPIEQRSDDEIRRGFGAETVAPGARCFNPAFDVTPAELITGIVTELGVVQPVSQGRILGFFKSRGCKG